MYHTTGQKSRNLSLGQLFPKNQHATIEDILIMAGFAKGALWLPSLLFFLVALFCLKKGLPLTIVLLTSFAAYRPWCTNGRCDDLGRF
jgi:hypothetical protein